MDRKFVSETELSAERHAELEAAKALLALHYASAPVNNTATGAQTNNRLLLFPYLLPTAASTATSEVLDSEEQEMSEAANILVAMANSPCQLTAPSENLKQKERPQVVEEPAKDDSEATISVSSRSSEDPPSHLNRPAMRPRPNKTTIVKHTIVQPPAVYDHVRLGPQAEKDGTVDKPIFIGDSSDSSDSDIEHASDAARAQVHARAVKTLSYPQITQQDNRHSSQHKHQKEVLSRKQQQETLSSRQGKPVASPTLRKDGAVSNPWIAKLYDAFLDDVVFRNLEYNVKSHRAGEHASKAFASFQDSFGVGFADDSTMDIPKDNPKPHFAQRFDSFVQALHINNRKGISNIQESAETSYGVPHNSQIGKATLTPVPEGRKIPELSLTNRAINSTMQSSTKQGSFEDLGVFKKHVNGDIARFESATQHMGNVPSIAGDHREAKAHVAKHKYTGTGNEATNTLNVIKKHNATTATAPATIKPQQSGSVILSNEPNESIGNDGDEGYSAVEFDDHVDGNGGAAIDPTGGDKSHAIGSGGTNTKKRAYYDEPDPFWRCHMGNKKR